MLNCVFKNRSCQLSNGIVVSFSCFLLIAVKSFVSILPHKIDPFGVIIIFIMLMITLFYYSTSFLLGSPGVYSYSQVRSDEMSMKFM